MQPSLQETSLEEKSRTKISACRTISQQRSRKERYDLCKEKQTSPQLDMKVMPLEDGIRSESSDESPDMSPSGVFDFAMAQAKHELIVRLMKDVYAMFDLSRTTNVRMCGASGSDLSTTQSYQITTESSSGSSRRNGKRRMQDRGSPPPGDGNGKRRSRGGSDADAQSKSRPFACPMHKHDPHKYSLNSGRGAMYRSCLGPGFLRISRLK